MNVMGSAWQVHSSLDSWKEEDAAKRGNAKNPDAEKSSKLPSENENREQKRSGEELSKTEKTKEEKFSNKQKQPLERYLDGLLERRREKEAAFEEMKKEQEVQKEEEDKRFREMFFEKTKDMEVMDETPSDFAINKKKIAGMFGIRSEAVRLSELGQAADLLDSGISILKSELHMDSVWKKRHGLWQQKDEAREKERKQSEQRLFETEAETIRRYEALQKNISAVRKMKMTNKEQRMEDDRPKSIYEQAAVQNSFQKFYKHSSLNHQLSGLQRARQYGRLKVDTRY